MTTRENRLAAGLGALIVAFVVGIGGYAGVVMPAQARYASAARIEAEAAEKSEKLDALRKNMARLADAKARSLPADPDVARREYEAALGRLLVEAKVPRGYTVRPKSPDARPVPEIGPKKPAYQRVAFEVTMKKVDLAALTNFLERYYKLELMHQITKLQVKRSEVESATPGGVKKSSTDRADLDVTIVTEAAILDGAEPRKSLRPVSPAVAAAAGAAAFHHVGQTPELARGLAPAGGPPVLGGTGRNYLTLLAKDPLHGPLPPPVVPSASVDSVRIADGSEAPAARFTVKLSAATGQTVTVSYATKDDTAAADRDYTPVRGVLTFAPGETLKTVNVPLVGTETLTADRAFQVVLSEPTGGAVLGSAKGTATLAAAPVVLKEDVSAFIKLTGITRRSDGSATADVKDAANNLDYQIDMRLVAGEPLVKVEKVYYIKDRRKVMDRGAELNISDDTSGTARKFRVVGLDADGLVLTAEPEKPKEAAAPAGRPGFGRKPVGPPVNPAVAVGGGAVLGIPRETVYVWRVGQPLKAVKQLPTEEGLKAVARAKTGWGPVAPAAVPTAASVTQPASPAVAGMAVTID